MDAQTILQQITTVPPLPDTALRLIAAVNDPASTAADIVETIKYDPAVTGQVLQLCNSAYFGRARKVTSLQEATVFLGTAKVLQLVMAVHSTSLMSKPQTGYGLEPGILWKHSVAVALAASAFAQRLELPNVGMLYTAGLLHDIGKIVLNQYVAEEFGRIVRQVSEEGMTFTEAEQDVLGFSHEQVGALIAEKWRLPEPIIRCIRHHHDPGAVDPPDVLLDTVYLANCVCLMLGVGLGEDGLCYRADEAVMKRRGLTGRELEIIGAQVLTELKQVEQLFERPAGEPLRTVAAGRTGA